MDASDARLTWRQIELQQAMGAHRARLNPDMRRQTAHAGCRSRGEDARGVRPWPTPLTLHAPWLPGGASDPAAHPERGRPGCGQSSLTQRAAGQAARDGGVGHFNDPSFIMPACRLKVSGLRHGISQHAPGGRLITR